MGTGERAPRQHLRLPFRCSCFEHIKASRFRPATGTAVSSQRDNRHEKHDRRWLAAMAKMREDAELVSSIPLKASLVTWNWSCFVSSCSPLADFIAGSCVAVCRILATARPSTDSAKNAFGRQFVAGHSAQPPRRHPHARRTCDTTGAEPGSNHIHTIQAAHRNGKACTKLARHSNTANPSAASAKINSCDERRQRSNQGLRSDNHDGAPVHRVLVRPSHKLPAIPATTGVNRIRIAGG